MTHVNILSGGAAQGLVAALAPTFKALTGLDIEGEFGAVGAMADKLRKGTPTDIVMLTAALVAKLAAEKLVVAASISDVGLVETAIAVRVRRSAGVRSAMPRRCARRSSRRMRSSCRTSRHRRPGFMSRRCCSSWALPARSQPRLKIYPNGATAMRHLAASDAARPIGCTQSTEIISTEAWCCRDRCRRDANSSTMYTAAVTTQAAAASQAQSLIDLLIGADQRERRAPARAFSDASK